jgi:hypothetical protein
MNALSELLPILGPRCDSGQGGLNCYPSLDWVAGLFPGDSGQGDPTAPDR